MAHFDVIVPVIIGSQKTLIDTGGPQATKGTCKAIQVKGPETKYIDFVIPNGLPPTSARAGGLVVCSYFFRLDMAQFDVIVPVIIGSQKTLIDTGGPQANK